MRKFLGLLLLLTLLNAAAARQIDTPQLASRAAIVLDENGTVTVTGGSMHELLLNLSIPLSTDYQYVEVDGAQLEDADGNPYLQISSSQPSNPFTYSKRMRVQTVARTTPSLPASYLVPEEFARYALPSARTQSDDPQIRALANEITAASEDPFEKVAKIAIWVNQHMEYDISLVGQERDALYTLQSRRGVCVEYSTLFAALARAAGIPARYSTGYVYSEKFNGWLGHAWNEVYLGKWVPVDSTWFEVGSTDALHVEAGKYLDLSREPQLVVSVNPPNSELHWQTSGKSGANADNIVTEGIDYSELDSDYELRAVESDLAPGDSTLAYFSIKGKDYRVIEVTLTPCSGEGSFDVAGGTQYLVIRPSRTTTAVWELRATSSIASNYIYTCPLTLNSPTLSQKTLEVRIDPRLHKLADYTASLEKSKVEPGEGNSAMLSLPDSRRAKDYCVIAASGAYCKRISASADSVEFASSGLGTVPLYVAGEGGGFKRLEYVSGGETAVTIDGFAVRQPMVSGKAAIAEANVSAKSYPVDVAIELQFGGEKIQRQGRISGPSQFTFEFTAPQEGSYRAKATASSNGALSDEKSALADVLPRPDVEIESVSRKLSGDNVLLTMAFASSGKPLEPKLTVAGKTYKAQGSVELLLPEGNYPVALSWRDAAGNGYEKAGELEVKKPGIFEDVQSKAASPSARPCPLAAVLLLIPFAAFVSRR